MTVPYERTRAVLSAGEFLRRLASPYNGGIKGIRSEIRQEARRILRHFPHWFDMGRVDCFDAAAAMEWGNADESAPAPHAPALPRPEWMDRPYWVDPPSGWKYGFPRLYDPAKDGPMREWLIKNHYPKALADKNLACTFTAKSEGSPHD